MSRPMGERALVVGAGIAGLASAAVLAEHFEQVVVLERDRLPASTEQRRYIPQGRHVHALLGGGLVALKELCDGFEQDLVDAGAVRLREGLDVVRETPFGVSFPRLDCGFDRFALSRPLLELLLRRRVMALRKVEFRTERTARALVAGPDGSSVVGVALQDERGADDTLPADLVIDAGGSPGTLTLDFLEATRQPRPSEERIQIDLGYATAVVDIPCDVALDWKGLVTLPKAPASSRGGLLLPIEGGRQWMVTAAGFGVEAPPREPAAWREFVKGLATPTLYTALRNARLCGEIEFFRFRADRLRHFEELPEFPRGLVPIGDVICALNPGQGQGMSVALKEVVALRRVLAESAGHADPLDGLALRFFAELPDIVEGPWTSVASADLAYPSSIGARPDDLELRQQVFGVLSVMIFKDLELLKLEAEIRNLMKPFRALRESGLWQRALEIVQSNAARAR